MPPSGGLLGPGRGIGPERSPSAVGAAAANCRAAFARIRSRRPVGEFAPGAAVSAGGACASAACTSSFPYPHEGLGLPPGNPVAYEVPVKGSWRAVVVRIVRACSGVRSGRRSSRSATAPVTIGVDIEVPLNRTCTPSVAMSALGAAGLLALEYTEKTPLPGAARPGFCRDGSAVRTGRVGPDDENVARSPTCSRTVNSKFPACEAQLTRLTWAATVMARAAFPGEFTTYALSPPPLIWAPPRGLLVAHSQMSNRPVA